MMWFRKTLGIRARRMCTSYCIFKIFIQQPELSLKHYDRYMAGFLTSA